METKTSEKEYLEAYGWVISQQSGIMQFGLSDEELDSIIAGIKHAHSKGKPSVNPEDIKEELQAYLQSRAEANMSDEQKAAMAAAGEDAEKNIAEGKAFIEKLVAENQNVKSTASGLHYEIHEAGGDKRAEATDQVKVHYDGTLIDGTVFDSSVQRGEPITFGLNQVIPGWTEGLQLVGEGGRITLYIPADIAYGNSGRPGLPGGSTLVFEVQLIEINPEGCGEGCGCH